jgi:glycosyltransferase involved in cell wall biosynthesis
MRIAMLGPVAWRTPPEHYGPWERVTSLLTEGLVAAGVDVTLFATLDSVTTAELDGVCPHGYATDPEMDGRIWEALHVAHAFHRSADFDLVHNQLDWLPLAFDRFCRAPLLTTIHGFSGPAILPAYVHSRSAFISISDSDRSPRLDYLATIHHGIDVEELPLGPGGESLVAFGRIHRDKGTSTAIEIARAAGRPLVICGPVQDQLYFDEQVAPHLDDHAVTYLGSVGPAERARVLGGAAALLHPIGFDEPFGLAVVEAMACGTPVVAYHRGSMPVVVDEGVTGYLATDVPSAVAAVALSTHLARPAIRERAMARFGVGRMVEQYLAAYRRMLT